MHRGTAGAFAKVVEPGHQHGMLKIIAGVLVGEHPEFHIVSVDQRHRVQLVVGCGRQDADPCAARVVFCERLVQVLGAGLARQQIQMQGQLHQHALLEIANRGDEHRAARQARVFHDFWNVFVLQTQPIQLECGRFAFFVGLNHAASAPRIAADRRQAQRKILRNQSGLNERANQRDGTSGVAARVGDPACLRDQRAMPRHEFGETKYPAGRGAVRGRGVDDLGADLACGPRRVVDHGDRFDSGVVVQAKHHQIDLCHQRAFGPSVLTQLGSDADQLDARHRLQAFPNLKAGGAGFAVNEDLVHGEFQLPSPKIPCKAEQSLVRCNMIHSMAVLSSARRRAHQLC